MNHHDTEPQNLGFKAILANCPLFYQLNSLILQIFYSDQPLTRLHNPKKWELEKIAKLGLAMTSTSPNRYLTRPLPLALWQREKIAYFGLSSPKPPKKWTLGEYFRDESETNSIESTSSYFPEANTAAHQAIFHPQHRNSDHFLKELGYE
jgi:hypothetical protein